MDKGKNDIPAHQPSYNRVIKASSKTFAARWNAKLLRGLETALKKDPEADFIALLPSDYSKTLQRYQKRPSELQACTVKQSFHDNDVRSRLSSTDSCTTIFEFSPELNALLRKQDNIPQSLVDLLAQSKIIYKSAWAGSFSVFRVSEDMVVKVTDERFATTELGSLLYLQKHLPSFPAPKPHGLVRLGIFCLLFTSYVRGIDLEKAWPQLHDSQKRDMSVQLDKLLHQLRLLPCPANMPLGGVQGEGCKDARSGLRVNTQPILDIKQFEDFIFAGSKTASPLYIEFLRNFMPASGSSRVFTHADIRPANIMVERVEDGSWRVVAIIDWEASGFYPDYWESVKITNTLTVTETFDWYKYLPGCVSPHRFPIHWLVDRLWDRNLVNS